MMRLIINANGARLLSSAIALSIFAYPAVGLAAASREKNSNSGSKRVSLEYRLDTLEQEFETQSAQLKKQQEIIEYQAYLIGEQKKALDMQRAETNRIRIELAGLEQQGRRTTAPRLASTSSSASGKPGRQLAVLQDVPVSGQPKAPESVTPASDAERPKSEKNVDQLLLDQGGVLLPPGTFQIEPSFEYTSISSDQVNISGFSIFNAILIGTIRVDDVNRDILTGALTARYGLARRVQVEARVPYVYRNDSETTGIGTGDAMTRHITGNGIGDISVTGSWQPFAANGWRPATILRLQAEFPTGKSAFEIERIAPEENSPERILTEAPRGSGFYTVSPGVTFVWPTDPVVLFAGGGYNYTFKRRFDQFGLVEPGHGFEFFAGMNLSLNELVSMNFSFINKQRFATKLNGVEIPGSGTNDARLTLGASIGLTDNVSLVLSASNGLTDESPDFTFGVRLPIAF